MATRDLPKSFGEFTTGWILRAEKEMTIFNRKFGKIDLPEDLPVDDEVIEIVKQKEQVEVVSSKKSTSRSQMLWTIFTAGAGLFSDGYINNSISTVSTCLSILYPTEYAESRAISNVSAIVFAGTVLGQLLFGYVSDYHSRKVSMIVSTLILIIFAILCSGSWGLRGSVDGMLAALTLYRFFLGIGIGGEYPLGSVACAELSALLPPGKRNRWFCWFTNFMIDLGFVISAFVPMVMLWICTPKHLTPVWRVTLGLGAIPPISLFFMRLKYDEGEQFQKYRFKKVRVPYVSVIKFYWFRLTVISILWFLYDFSVYAFGLYSSTILSHVIGVDPVTGEQNLYQNFGWNVVINLFYIPGAFLGAIAADYIGPRIAVVSGVLLQAIVGYIMAGCYEQLDKHVAAFVVVYGIFLSLGEFGPGDNIGVLASKTSATPIRGQYYGICAAVGKVGAFVGTYVFPILQKNAGGADTLKGKQLPFWVASSLCVFSALLALFCLPPVDQEAVEREDRLFLEYLTSTGFDISQLGDEKFIDSDLTDDNSSEDVIKINSVTSVQSAAKY